MKTDKALELPFFAKAALILIGIAAFLGILYLLQPVLVPILYAFITAIMVNPLVRFLVKKNWNRGIAIFVSLLLTLSVIALVIAFLSSQIATFAESLPKIIDKFSHILHQGVHWVSDRFNISTEKVNAFAEDAKADILKNGKAQFAKTVASVGDTLIITILVPVYIFIILFYQPLLVAFIRKLFGKGNISKVDEVLTSIRDTTQRYLYALLFETLIIAVLNSLALVIVGIDFAIVLGVIGALVNVIPYIGALFGLVLPVLVAFATKTPAYAFWIIVLYLVIQIFDNYYLIPKIVSSKIDTNALVLIIAVFISITLWGIAGMFLAIPLVAIIKVICDHIESLKPWGYLLGDAIPRISFFRAKAK